MMLDTKRATSLLIQQKDLITPAEVVPQLLKAGDKCDFRYFLYLYLHALFEASPHAGRDFHDMQVLYRSRHLFSNSKFSWQAPFMILHNDA